MGYILPAGDLSRLVSRAGEREVTLTFAQVEALIGRPLPDAARAHASWWRNATDPREAESYPWYGWLSTGWEAAADVPGGAVTFRYRRAAPA
ncbi:MAG: hypothetical protein M3Q65_21880 [Chloroflexota bacterium]|nr:hypothetical protein [Chloroflexota bacterium]